MTARLPLMVRPSPPRFLNFGDTFRLPVVVQNQTDAPMTVRVAVRATNAAITDGAGREVTVPANDRVEVQFPAAAELAGTARFQVIASSGGFSDAAELALPVWTPATTEAFATYGVIDAARCSSRSRCRARSSPQFGGLEVTTASTNLQALTDALLYLVHYPFECAEQRSSRILAIAALRDVLTAFHTKDLPSAAEMEKSVASDIEHLSQMQNYDGGFAYWDRGYPSEPYLTRVRRERARRTRRRRASRCPAGCSSARMPYLKNDRGSTIPAFYPDDVRWAISAYALYTRKQLGDVDIAKGQRLLASRRRPGQGHDGDRRLAARPVRAAERTPPRSARRSCATRLNHVSETAGAANFTTGYGDGNYLLLVERPPRRWRDARVADRRSSRSST